MISGIGLMTVSIQQSNYFTKTVNAADLQFETCETGELCADETLRDRDMASFGPCHWWNSLPWSHGHKWCHLPRFAATVLAGGYSKHLCPPCTCLLRSYCGRILSHDVGNVHLPISGIARGCFHGNYSRLYLAFGGRKLRQRGDCHLLVGLYILPLDQVGQEWVGYVGCLDGSILWIYGICMGRLRVHYKSVTFACIRSHFDGKV